MRHVKPRSFAERLTIEDWALLTALQIDPGPAPQPQPIEGLILMNDGPAQCPNCDRKVTGLWLDADLADSMEAPNCSMACKACHLQRRGVLRPADDEQIARAIVDRYYADHVHPFTFPSRNVFQEADDNETWG